MMEGTSALVLKLSPRFTRLNGGRGILYIVSIGQNDVTFS